MNEINWEQLASEVFLETTETRITSYREFFTSNLERFAQSDSFL